MRGKRVADQRYGTIPIPDQLRHKFRGPRHHCTGPRAWPVAIAARQSHEGCPHAAGGHQAGNVALSPATSANVCNEDGTQVSTTHIPYGQATVAIGPVCTDDRQPTSDALSDHREFLGRRVVGVRDLARTRFLRRLGRNARSLRRCAFGSCGRYSIRRDGGAYRRNRGGRLGRRGCRRAAGEKRRKCQPSCSEPKQARWRLGVRDCRLGSSFQSATSSSSEKSEGKCVSGSAGPARSCCWRGVSSMPSGAVTRVAPQLMLETQYL